MDSYIVKALKDDGSDVTLKRYPNIMFWYDGEWVVRNTENKTKLYGGQSEELAVEALLNG
jgi:hypothetical protein